MLLISVTAEVWSSESVDQLSCSGSLPSTSRRTTESCAAAWSFSPQKCCSALPSPDPYSFSPELDTGKPLHPPSVFSSVPPLTKPSCSRKHLMLHTVSAACQGVILPSFSSHPFQETPEDWQKDVYCFPTSAVCQIGFCMKSYMHILWKGEKQRHLCQILNAGAEAQCLPVLPVAENTENYSHRRRPAWNNYEAEPK